MKSNLFVLSMLALFFFPDLALAKDFSQSINSLKSEINDILMIAAPLALMVAGGAFFVSRNTGINLLASSGIGIAVFAASGTIFQFLYRIFN